MMHNNEKYKRKYFRYNNILLILLFYYISFSSSLKNNKLIYESEITITISGYGTQQILTNNITISKEELVFGIKPSEILVNDKQIDNIDFYVYNLTEEENNITMKFNIIITNCNVMFYGLSNITKIDLSKFDSSQVTNMAYMFYGCNNLISIDLSNFNTSSVTNMQSMFEGCSKLISLDLSNFNTSSVTNMQSMFEGYNKLISLDLSNFDTSSVTNMYAMFEGCNNLISLDLSNFDTSSVTNMYAMFEGCNNLISLDLSNFNTSSVNNMQYMFYECSNLISLDLSNFNTSSVTNMKYMFDDCSEDLIYCINNENNKVDNLIEQINKYKFKNNNKCSDICFDKNKKIIFDDHTCVINILNCGDIYKYEYKNICYTNSCPKGTHNIFNNEYLCTDICKKYYNYNKTSCIENIPEGYYLNDSNLKTFDKCNIECKICSLESNKYNSCIECNNEEGYYEKENEEKIENQYVKCYNDILNNTFTLNNSNSNEICDYFHYFDENNEHHCTQKNKCPINYRNLIKNKSKCINKCEDDNDYQYKYNNLCFNTCPEKTNISKNNKYLCERECPNNNPYENENYECINECNATNLFDNLCNIKTKEAIIKDIMIKNITQELLNGTLNSIIEQVVEGEKEDLIIEDNEFIYQITSTENQNNNENNDISTIILGECENKLRKHYNISEDQPLIISKFDFYKEGLLIPIIGYEVYDSKINIKLDLKVCDGVKIKLIIPVKKIEKEEFKHNKSNEYYNDICHTFTTEFGTDITITDRKNEFNNNNLSLCEVNCDYEGYIPEKKKSKCECQVKIRLPLISEIVFNKEQLLNNFVDINNATNFKVIKCANIVFTKEGLKNNIGNYVILSIILIIVIFNILFIFKGYKLLCDIIDLIWEKKKNNTNINSCNNVKKISKMKKKVKKKKKLKKNFTKNEENKINIFINNPPRKINILSINNEDEITSGKISELKLIKSQDLINGDKKGIINNINVSIYKKSVNNYIDYNEYELNNLEYKEALKFDKRNSFQYYLSLLKKRNALIFTFYTKNDYNSRYIKMCTFFFSFALYFAINAFFFNDATMHKIYKDQGNFDFIYQIPQILYSSIICVIINNVIIVLSLTEKNILSIKRMNKIKKEIISDKKRLIVKKSIILYIIMYILCFLFWYYLSCFCAVYKNTQVQLMKDTIVGFCFSFIYPFFICLIPVGFRMLSLKKDNRQCLYKISQFTQLL